MSISVGKQEHKITNALIPREYRSARFIIYVVAWVSILAAIWILSYYLVSQERQKAHDSAVENANGIATFFERHVADTFRYADDYIKSARRVYAESRSLDAIRRYMSEIPPDATILSHITVMGADGVPLLISDGRAERRIKPGINARDRDYFKTQKASASDQVVISLARKGRNTGLVTVRLVRRLMGPDGEFGGVIFAAVKATQLLAFFETTRIGPDSSATIVGLDKIIRLRSPAIPKGANRHIEKSRLWAHLEKSPRGVYHQTSIVDGVPRFWTYRKVVGFSMVSVIGTALPNIEAAFAGTARIHYGIAGLIGAIISVLFLFAIREHMAMGRLAVIHEQQMRVEGALSASERRNRLLAESSPEGIIVHTDGKIVYANPAIVSMLHADGPDALLGTDPMDLIHPDDRAGVLERRRRVAETGQSDLEQARFVCFDGETINVERIGTKFEWEGQPSILLMMRDVTEQIRARELLLESEKRYRDVIENAPYAVVVTRQDGIMEFANQTAVQLFRAESAEQFVGKNNLILMHPDHHGNADSRRQQILGGCQMPFVERKRIRFDGTEFMSESSGSLCTWKGEPGVLIGIRDISDRLKAEEKLRESERTNKEISELIPAAYLIQSKGKIVFANALANQMFDVPEGSGLVGADGLSLVDDAFRGQVLARRITVQDSGRPSAMAQTRHRTLNGEILETRSIVGPFNWEGEPATINIIVDQTEYQRLESQLRQAQKMEAVGQLTGGVAHDFNNLLTVILGNAELLADGPDGNNARTQAILRASKRGSELTHRLLAFSRQQPLNPQVMDLAELMTGLSELLARPLGETIDIELKSAPDLWPIMVDPGQLESALLNLAINARDAMPTGGKLTTECSNARLDGDYIAEDHDAVVGDYVVMAVSDTGTGMSSEVLAHAFEPFFTTKEVGAGSGLGLSMIYGFAKQSGGLVNIYSEEGKGTTIKLYLPRGETDTRREASAVEDVIPPGLSEMILIIEDDEDVRDFASEMLLGLGYRVIAVPSAKEARNILAAGEQVDLVLSDVVLPGGMSGPEFAEDAKKDYPDLRIIFMSGYHAEAAKRSGFLGADTVLINKPFQIRQLAEAVRNALD